MIPLGLLPAQGYAKPGQTGFTLVETMIAIVVAALGLLGIAKMQAAAIANTHIAATRSLIALQAASLAAAMQGNHAYWNSGQAPATFSTRGTTVTDASGQLTASGVNCVASTANVGACTPVKLAAYDVQTWAATMSGLFPGYASNTSCTTTASTQINCAITVTWVENYVGINRTTTINSANQSATQSFTLYVAP